MAAATPFRVEAWVEYAIGIVILISRIALRTSVVGWDWHGDDYFAVAAVVFLTGETAMLELIGQWGSIVGMTDEIALSMTAAERSKITKGAKANMAGWCLYLTLVWCLKACMLFFYCRLTLDTRQRRLVVFAGVACVCSYISIIGVVLLRCLPFHKNWQVYPYPGDNCTSPNQILLALVTTNVLTDLIILYIPLPLLWVVRLPLSRKIVYGLWLTTGIFVIAASLLRCVLSIRDASEIDISTIWAIRETFVGIIAVNSPILGPWLVRKGANIVHGVSSKDQPKSDEWVDPNAIITIGQQNHRLERLKRDKNRPSPGWTTVNDSQEYIVEEDEHADVAKSNNTTGYGQPPSNAFQMV